MIDIYFTPENVDLIIRAFKEAPRRVEEALSRAVRKSALLVERESKRQAPVDTGRLRGSIYTTILPFYATVQPKTNYAIFVHEGTRFMTSRPFMKWGAESAEPQINALFEQEVRKALEQ